MDGAALLFFSGHEGALPLFTALDAALRTAADGVSVKVQKTQISYYSRHLFACVSFLPARRAAARPKDFVTLTLCLPDRLISPRVDQAVEPYPNRWTHHLTLSDPAEIDAELTGWIGEAAAFAAAKR